MPDYQKIRPDFILRTRLRNTNQLTQNRAMNKKKKMLLMVSLLAITSVLFGILIYSSKSDSKNINSEVSLRANAEDVSLDDMMNSKSSPGTLTQSEPLPSENISSASTVSEDNPEAIQQVQELIRRNQENINGGQEMITHERNRVYTDRKSVV